MFLNISNLFPRKSILSVLRDVETYHSKNYLLLQKESSYRSDSVSSPDDKRLKESNSPGKISSDEDGVMEVLGPKIDLVLSKLNVAVKGLQSKVTS